MFKGLGGYICFETLKIDNLYLCYEIVRSEKNVAELCQAQFNLIDVRVGGIQNPKISLIGLSLK